MQPPLVEILGLLGNTMVTEPTIMVADRDRTHRVRRHDDRPRDRAAGPRPPRGDRRRPQRAELSSTARANTASSIASVRRPVNVFCWLGWNEHSSVGPPAQRDLDAVTEPRARAARRMSARRLVPERAEAHDDARRHRARRARGGGTARSCRARPASARSPAARTSPPRSPTFRRGAGRRRSTPTSVGWRAPPGASRRTGTRRCGRP